MRRSFNSNPWNDELVILPSGFQEDGWGDVMYGLSRGGRSRGRGRVRGRGRGNSRGRGRRGGRYNWNWNAQPAYGRNNVKKPFTRNVPIPELVEPKKVFVHNILGSVTEEDLKYHLRKFAKVLEVVIIKKNTPNFRPYAFVTLETEEDTQIILNLEKRNRLLGGKAMEFQPAKMQFKIPGMPGFQRNILSDREFDLEPADPAKPCIHILIDDVLLKILEFLPLRDLLCLDRVCRRWQSLLHASFRSKANLMDMKNNLNTWLERHCLPPTLPIISKVLILCGEQVTSLTIGEYASDGNQGKVLRVIGQLCPSLESITLLMLPTLNTQYLKDLVNSCRNLKAFSIMGRSSFNDMHLTYLLMSLPTLETLRLEGADIYGQCFNKLPDTLEVLHLSHCLGLISSSIDHIPKRCQFIKSLHIESIGTASNVLEEISRNCLCLEELSAKLLETTDMSAFKSLKKLKIIGHLYSINDVIKQLPQLEELSFEGLIKETSMDTIDFSLLPKLRVLNLPVKSSVSFSVMSIKSISFCSNLVTLKYKGSQEHKSALLEIIRRCHNLKELDCLTVTLKAEDIEPFVEATKRRTNRLKFVIGLDKGAMEQIEKLSEAKYDVEMFDADNLFRDAEDFFAGFGAFNQINDMLDDFDYDSEDSYDDIWDDIDDFGIVGMDNWDDWEDFGLHPFFNWGFHDDEQDEFDVEDWL